MAKELSKMELISILGRGIIASDGVITDLRSQHPTLSKWLLGGALAICYSIFCDPVKFCGLYGGLLIKFSFLSLIVSIFFGVLNILTSQVRISLSNNNLLKNLIDCESNEADQPSPHGEHEKELNDMQMIQMTVERVVKSWAREIKISKNLWLQIFFLGLPLIGIVISFTFKKVG